MSLFTFFSGSGSNTFKNKVKTINDNDTLTDAEKMAAIDLLLNPIYLYGLNFSDGQQITFSDNQTIQYGVN